LKRWWPSCHQRRVAHHRSTLALSSAAAYDRRLLEECHRRRTICCSPAARRVGSMGERAKRRSERSFVFPHAGRIRSLRTRGVDTALSRGEGLVRSRTYVQAHAGNRPDCPSSPRLLATLSF